MIKLTLGILAFIVGGVAIPDFNSMSCTELQNYAGIHQHDLTPEQWDSWAKAYENNCLGGSIIVTPPSPDPTDPDN